MKIGILTYQYAINYGAQLQAYALKEFLNSYGYEVEIINYDTSYMYIKNRSIKNRIISKIWYLVKYFIGGREKKIKFNTFKKKRLQIKGDIIADKNHLQKYLEIENFDVIIVGSDQVWNPEINGNDDAYYLNLENNIIKISYAASFGVSSLNKKYIQNLKDCLNKFSSISVREKTGKKIINSIGLDAEVVLDPVFLLEKEKWLDISSKNRIVNECYILCYVMPGDKELENKIEYLALQIRKQTGKEIVFLGRKEYKKFKRDGKDFISASPEEFVNLFFYADIVITNSFHGTAFSIIFNKNFYSLINSNVFGVKQLSSRLTDLLFDLGLENRIVNVKDENIDIDKINYIEVNRKLNKMKDKSKSYLQTALCLKKS